MSLKYVKCVNFYDNGSEPPGSGTAHILKLSASLKQHTLHCRPVSRLNNWADVFIVLEALYHLFNVAAKFPTGAGVLFMVCFYVLVFI